MIQYNIYIYTIHLLNTYIIFNINIINIICTYTTVSFLRVIPLSELRYFILKVSNQFSLPNL